jgi:tetratricopeptide (TPR) repeat protein
MSIVHAPLAILLSSTLALPGSILGAAPPPPPVEGGAGPDVSSMSDEDRVAKAKELYGEADSAFQAGDFANALTKFEEAYDVYAPSFHVFNINIALAAHEIGDCVKAKKAFQRFLDLVPEHPSRSQAQEKLLEIDRSGCANVQPEPPPDLNTTAPVTEDVEEAPLLTSRSNERDEAADQERAQRSAKKQHPLVITGAVLTAVGAAAIIGGGVAAGLANAKANRLAKLASPGPTGFPDGNYSDDEVFNLDRNGLPANNAAYITLFVVGGAVAVTGVALLVVGLKRKKEERRAIDKNAYRSTKPQLVGVGPSVLPRGGGAAATLRF